MSHPVAYHCPVLCYIRPEVLYMFPAVVQYTFPEVLYMFPEFPRYSVVHHKHSAVVLSADMYILLRQQVAYHKKYKIPF